MKQRYNTKQQTIVYNLFKNNEDHHYNADEVCAALKDNGVSRATVYRTIEKLAEEGILLKYNFGKGQSSCYQFCTKEHVGSTYHFVCTNCKSVQHLECKILNQLTDHLDNDHALKIDRSLTVFYGICTRCLKQ